MFVVRMMRGKNLMITEVMMMISLILPVFMVQGCIHAVVTTLNPPPVKTRRDPLLNPGIIYQYLVRVAFDSFDF